MNTEAAKNKAIVREEFTAYEVSWECNKGHINFQTIIRTGHQTDTCLKCGKHYDYFVDAPQPISGEVKEVWKQKFGGTTDIPILTIKMDGEVKEETKEQYYKQLYFKLKEQNKKAIELLEDAQDVLIGVNTIEVQRKIKSFLKQQKL